MKEIKCPRCNRKAKLRECISHKRDRKRIMVDFPCNHYPCLVYNVPCSMDNNTIIKDFKSFSENDFEQVYDMLGCGDRYLNLE